MKKALKLILIIFLALAAVGAITFDLITLAVGNGSLGSSFEQKTNLTIDAQKTIAYNIYMQSCKNADLTRDEFANGMNPGQASECNDNWLTSGIKFVGEKNVASGNGNEMYLLSHNYWDVRVLYATYYLLQRGFDGPDPYSLRMDCSAPGFDARPKMTLGVHYINYPTIGPLSMINSIQDPQPNRENQYVVNGTGNFNPEGSGSHSNTNGISPHAYGQALDVYTFGCTSVYVRLDSDVFADKWACGKTQHINQHSYFYPIKNIPIEIDYARGIANFSSAPDNSREPDPQEPYLLDPRPGLDSCNKGGITSLTVQSTYNPPITPVINYTNAGCIAQNQPNRDQKYYKSNYFYGLPKLGYYSDSNSRVQPFQYLEAVPILPPAAWDGCTCKGKSINEVNADVPDSDRSAYLSKNVTLNLANIGLTLKVPPELERGLDDNGLKKYLKKQAEASRSIILESSMLFSLRQNNDKYQAAENYFSELVGSGLLPRKQMLMNQIVTSSGGANLLSASYGAVARLLYGDKGAILVYDFGQVVGHQRGMGYNSSQSDRIHLGF